MWQFDKNKDSYIAWFWPNVKLLLNVIFLRCKTFACFADYLDIGQMFVQINKTLIISETRRERDFPRKTSKIVMLVKISFRDYKVDS